MKSLLSTGSTESEHGPIIDEHHLERLDPNIADECTVAWNEMDLSWIWVNLIKKTLYKTYFKEDR